MNSERKHHWEKVYETKSPSEVSWTQEKPVTSLDFILSFDLPKSAPIIDVGGGDILLVDNLLNLGYTDITVLDISGKALERAKKRLGKLAEKVDWIESDISQFNPTRSYSIWHDRAAFHFLTSPQEIRAYSLLVENYVAVGLTIGTFSEKGPLKCSGLEIAQYNEKSLTEIFQPKFLLNKTQTVFHTTPFDTQQHFLFCGFTRNSN